MSDLRRRGCGHGWGQPGGHELVLVHKLWTAWISKKTFRKPLRRNAGSEYKYPTSTAGGSTGRKVRDAGKPRNRWTSGFAASWWHHGRGCVRRLGDVRGQGSGADGPLDLIHRGARPPCGLGMGLVLGAAWHLLRDHGALTGPGSGEGHAGSPRWEPSPGGGALVAVVRC